MNNEELISFIETYVRNSPTDSFTNLRLNAILKNLAQGSSVTVLETYTDFELLYTLAPTKQFVAIVTEDDKYGNDGVEYKFIPGLVVMLAGLELIEPIES